VTPPSHIGQYRIVRKIGAGGMGLVYLGEHTLLRRRAAIKTLLPTVAANREIVERFFNEARATSAITDPGVIQVYDFGYHVDGTAYIVMELLEGEALSARLDRLGRLPLGDALRFARQVAVSLGAAHARDIVHRDLKPENIFLVRDSEAQGGERTKIIDFGICKMGSGDPTLTEAGAMIGTPVYMSPEQCRGSGDVDARSDIYAFGCLLFHMVTGRPPFIGDASGDLIVAHLQEEPPPAARFTPELPAEVDALLARCLAKEPSERFASMTALQVELGELAAVAEAAAPLAAAPPRTVPLGRGFRSVFDANLAAAATGSALSSMGPGSPIPQALRSRLWFASPPPGSTPSSGEVQASSDADDVDDDIDDDVAELRQGSGQLAVRAALACVLVVGMALGLVLTLSGDDEPAARTDHGAVLASDQLAAKVGAVGTGEKPAEKGDAKLAAAASAKLVREGDTKLADTASEQLAAKVGAVGTGEKAAENGDANLATTAGDGRGAQAGDQLAASGGAEAADKAPGQADDSTADQDDDGGMANKAAKQVDDRRSRSRAAESRAGKPASVSRTSRAVRSAPASAPVVRPSASAPPASTSPASASAASASPASASPASPPPSSGPVTPPSPTPAAGAASTAPRPVPPPPTEDLYDTR
jgi:serine/threonine-protein kinase